MIMNGKRLITNPNTGMWGLAKATMKVNKESANNATMNICMKSKMHDIQTKDISISNTKYLPNLTMFSKATDGSHVCSENRLSNTAENIQKETSICFSEQLSVRKAVHGVMRRSQWSQPVGLAPGVSAELLQSYLRCRKAPFA